MKSNQRSQSGQSMVELALSIPFLLLCLVAIMYFGRAYFITQTISFAAQEGAKVASRLPSLSSDPNALALARGFDASGAPVPNSIVYSILNSAKLLDQDGKLPPAGHVRVLPFDSDPTIAATPGAITVVVEYPFSLLVNPFTGQTSGKVQSVSLAMQIDDPNPVQFADFNIKQSATVAPQVYEEGI